MLPWEDLEAEQVFFRALHGFGGALNTRVPLNTNYDFHEENVIRDVVEEEKNKVLDEFDRDIRDVNDDQRVENLRKLSNEIEKVVSLYICRNSENKKVAKLRLDVLVKKLVKKYNEAMSTHLKKDKYLQFEMLLAYHESEKLEVINFFMQERKPGNNQFHIPYLLELEEEIRKLYEKMEEKHKLSLQEFWNKEDALIVKQKDKFKAKLAKAYGTKVQNAEELKKESGDIMLSFLMEFNKSDNHYPGGSPESSYLVQRLKQELSRVVEIVGMEIEEKRVKNMKAADAPKEAVNLCTAFYNSKMDKLRDKVKKGFMDDVELESCHQIILQDAIRKYNSLAKLQKKEQDHGLWVQADLDLKRRLERNFELRKADNLKRRSNANKKAEAIRKYCLGEYTKKMEDDLEKEIANENFFDRYHSEAKKVALESFSERTRGKDSVFYRTFLDSLEVKIEENKQEFQQYFRMKLLAEKNIIKGVLLGCQRHYDEEMKKRCEGELFVKPRQLEKAHEKARAYLVSQCIQRMAGNRLSGFQKTELEKEIEVLYDFYKIRNDMKLNSSGAAPTIGIDLGTTYSCVAVFFNGEVRICPFFNSEGELTIPSYVSFTGNNLNEVRETVGPQAKKFAYQNPENTLFDVKRIIGRKMNDESIRKNKSKWPFEVKEFEGGIPKVGIFDGKKYYAPEEISAKVLYELIRMAEEYIGLPRNSIKNAVITVPANFNDGQRQATKDAGIMAGLEEVTLLNEPTAAAVAYSLLRLRADAEKVLVFDLGGGTFDVCIMNVKKREIEVLATSGDTNLGGQDFDKNLMTFCAQEFKKQFGSAYDIIGGMEQTSNKEIRDECKKSWGRLQTYVEAAKARLSSGTLAQIHVPHLYKGKALTIDVTREKFEELNKDLFNRTITLLEDVMNSKGIRKEEIEEIVLVGGSTKIPKIQSLLEDCFEGKSLTKSIQPDHAVAYGAAVMAALKYAEDAKRKINFDRIQDVISMSLGIAVQMFGTPGHFSRIIPKFTQIPKKITETGYSTAHDNQTTVCIEIFQGEGKMVKDNELLGNFDLSGLRPAPAKEVKLDVCMEIDEMGILHVTATSQDGGQTNSLSVTEFKSRMTKEAIQAVLAEETLRRTLRDVQRQIDELAKEVEKFSGPHFTKVFKQHKELGEKLEKELNDMEADVLYLDDLKLMRCNSVEAVSQCLRSLDGKTHADGQSCASCEILV